MFLPEARRRFRLNDAASDALAAEVKQQIDQAGVMMASNLPTDYTGTQALSPDEASQQAMQQALITASNAPLPGSNNNTMLYLGAGLALLFFMSKKKRR